MQTPPIPPKSEFFSMLSVADTECEDCSELVEDEVYPNMPYFTADSQWLGNREYDAICVCHNDSRARLIIAAVAEVEWRKRAERWHSLYCKWYGFMSDRPRFNPKRAKQCLNANLLADKNALAWRAWGEQK